MYSEGKILIPLILTDIKLRFSLTAEKRISLWGSRALWTVKVVSVLT